MGGVCLYLSCLLLCLLLARPAAADDDRGSNAVTVEPLVAARMETRPGQVLTALFRVTNTRTRAHTFTERLDLPEGWQVVLPLADFLLAPRADHFRLVSFLVPAQTAVGRYQIRYAVRSRSDAEGIGQGHLNVFVLPVHRLALTALDMPRFVRAGTAYEAHFLVENRGNTTAEVQLNVTSTGGFDARPDAGRLSLPPQATQRVTVHVATQDEHTTLFRHSVRLEAAVTGVPETTATAAANVDVLPSARAARAPQRSYPLLVTLGATGDERAQGGFVQMQGAGKLLGGLVETLIRLPNQQATSIYGERSQYSVGYARNGVSVRLGDQVYALSPLTEAGRYGVGGDVRVRRDRFTVGAFYQQGRQAFVPDRQRGALVTYHMSPRLDLQTSYLNREGAFPGETVTLRARATPTPTTLADAECGLGRSDGLGQSACMVTLEGTGRAVSYNAQHIRATPRYPGYYQHTDATSASLSVAARTWLRLDGSWQQTSQGYEARADAPLLRRTGQNLRLGTSFTGAWPRLSTFLSFFYQNEARAYLGGPAPSAQRRNALQVRAGFRAQGVGLDGGALFGHSDGDQTGPGGPYREYRLQAHVVANRRHTFSASLEHLSGHTLFTPMPQQQWMGSLKASLGLTDRTRVSVNLLGLRDDARAGANHYLAQVYFEHILTNGHRIVLREQHAFGSLTGQPTADYSLTYTLPFYVPTGPREQGQRGRLYDAETGHPLADVMIRLGDAVTLTGRDGTFAFPPMPAGTHLLLVDHLSLGLDRIPLQEMPMQVTLADGRPPAPLEIGVVRSTRLSGRLEQAAGEAFPADARVVLELAGPAGRSRTATDARGHFTFGDVRPGPWTLRVVQARLPDHHALAEEQMALQLAPGDTHTVVLHLHKKRRTPRILVEETLTLDDQPPTPRPVSPATPVASAGHTAPAGLPAAADEATYVVQDGDCLTGLAQAWYADARQWTRIWEANRDRLAHPDLLLRGMVLTRPPALPAATLLSGN